MESDVITLQDIFVAKPPDEKLGLARQPHSAAVAAPVHGPQAALPREARRQRRRPARRASSCRTRRSAPACATRRTRRSSEGSNEPRSCCGHSPPSPSLRSSSPRRRQPGSRSPPGVDTAASRRSHATVVSSPGAAVTPAADRERPAGRGLRCIEPRRTAKAVVLAIDDSQSMAGAPAPRRRRRRLERSSLRSRRADAVSVISFGPPPGVAERFLDRDDRHRRRAAQHHRRQSARERALTTRSSGCELSCATSPLVGRVIIVLTDGRDVSSTSDARKRDRSGRARRRRLDLPDRHRGPGLRSRAAPAARDAQTGGHYYGAASTAALDAGLQRRSRKRSATRGRSPTSRPRAPATISISRPPSPVRARRRSHSSSHLSPAT